MATLSSTSRHALGPEVLSGGQADLGEKDQTESSGGQEEEDGGGQRGHPSAVGTKGGEHRDGLGDGGTRGHGAAFHAARETMVSGPSDVGDEEKGTGGAVLD